MLKIISFVTFVYIFFQKLNFEFTKILFIFELR